MRIASWNVNSLNARLEHVTGWLSTFKPDVLLLQETKVTDDKFPREPIEDLGYNIALHGQKTYNGVAILSKLPLEDITKTLPGDDTEDQCRFLEAVVGTRRVISVYVPNGQEPGSDKFAYKMAFYNRLRDHLAHLLRYEEAVIVGGDYNVAPDPLDAYDPVKCANKLLFTGEERAKITELKSLGYYDAFRSKYPTKKEFSWWDYREGSWQGNKGMRIDYLMLSPQAADQLDDAGIDLGPRGLPRASDHTPVWCTLRD